MKPSPSLGLLALAFAGSTSAFIGYGIPMYKPNCAFACYNHFGDAMLHCSTADHGGGAHDHGAGPTSPECRANNEPWLTTLAYCINATCTDVAPWKLEKYWADKCTGDPAVPAKWTYAQTLMQLEKNGKPTNKELMEHDGMDMLTQTTLYDEETWEEYRGTLWHFEWAETVHSRYG